MFCPTVAGFLASSSMTPSMPASRPTRSAAAPHQRRLRHAGTAITVNVGFFENPAAWTVPLTARRSRCRPATSAPTTQPQLRCHRIRRPGLDARRGLRQRLADHHRAGGAQQGSHEAHHPHEGDQQLDSLVIVDGFRWLPHEVVLAGKAGDARRLVRLMRWPASRCWCRVWALVAAGRFLPPARRSSCAARRRASDRGGRVRRRRHRQRPGLLKRGACVRAFVAERLEDACIALTQPLCTCARSTCGVRGRTAPQYYSQLHDALCRGTERERHRGAGPRGALERCGSRYARPVHLRVVRHSRAPRSASSCGVCN